MKIPADLGELTALFERLGARNPEGWARSQLDKGIPQLQRFLFLKQAWERIVRDDDTEWVQSEIQQACQHPDAPYAGVGHALRRCMEKGVAAQDLTDVVRGMQANLLFDLCYMLDDPLFPEDLDLSWGLFEVDENGKPFSPRIGSLYESVLDTDPTGREMRPRKPT
jgi:hypothetical protein